MARIPSVAALQRRLNEAKTREAALKARQATAEPKVGSGQRNPTDPLKYESIFTASAFNVNASRSSVAFFGGIAALGLAAADDSPKLPRGFHPSKIRATRGRAQGVRKVAELSKRPYLKYSVDADNDTRGTYTAPISSNTAAGLQLLYRNILTAKKDDVGEYGRIAFIPERPLFSSSGSGAAPVA